MSPVVTSSLARAGDKNEIKMRNKLLVDNIANTESAYDMDLETSPYSYFAWEAVDSS